MPGIDVEEIDITRDVCPMTFVRTRLALDRLAPGGRLQVRLRGDEPLDNVSRSVRLLGHEVAMHEAQDDGLTHVLLIIKKMS
ncbi:sulfurtransferase TusA family protein [Gluconacetobacter entanii]|uniref:SirA family protein n=1 Tax=Gluconacetobacter entanii TaxID=108528 RepID=A0A318PZ22_9PROT|nr:sulfurtransferase TusA family protein [Gluconacetobacter entanii]MBE7620560.1 sulfurtransferase TusA family protein [Komagataeibacter sp. FXV2]MCE2579169.1 sulfurtransferase TusA family protein [Komagataeibacter sp. FNDCR1]MBY4640899.1 sulfurtransferase TusA family protein [Gluconacetobacter entanii]MCW4580518.1 sulfurtransferase TusA family protein [Gluconacetobacter entanii]MCW4583861.1 sulfurtransferase TusA family protein [Gluconacetobacter entanii]